MCLVKDTKFIGRLAHFGNPDTPIPRRCCAAPRTTHTATAVGARLQGGEQTSASCWRLPGASSQRCSGVCGS